MKKVGELKKQKEKHKKLQHNREYAAKKLPFAALKDKRKARR